MTRDYKKQYEWMKENKIFISVGLMRKTDQDIIDYLDKKKEETKESRNSIIKSAIREKMEREEKEL